MNKQGKPAIVIDDRVYILEWGIIESTQFDTLRDLRTLSNSKKVKMTQRAWSKLERITRNEML